MLEAQVQHYEKLEMKWGLNFSGLELFIWGQQAQVKTELIVEI